ncbi:MAG TPA: nicotinate-nucleotide adenylyltransferase [Gemmatimonadales bacterium]|nr:nicotinate-nucleotide adenylyltransferase [Gemmatimonadales bacterium]
MRVGVLGGSFDPIHHGHLIVAQALREQLALDEVRLVPAGTQPFKGGRHAASAEHRARMVAVATEAEPGLVLDRSELERPGPSYTVVTLRELRGRLPGVELVLLVGSDAAAELPTWHEAQAIPDLATVVPFQRPGEVAHAPGAVAVPAVSISSTDVRARVRAGRSIRYWVPERVAEYIATHRLYQEVRE